MRTRRAMKAAAGDAEYAIMRCQQLTKGDQAKMKEILQSFLQTLADTELTKMQELLKHTHEARAAGNATAALAKLSDEELQAILREVEEARRRRR